MFGMGKLSIKWWVPANARVQLCLHFQSPFVAFLRASVEPRFLLPVVSVIQRQTA